MQISLPKELYEKLWQEAGKQDKSIKTIIISELVKAFDNK